MVFTLWVVDDYLVNNGKELIRCNAKEVALESMMINASDRQSKVDLFNSGLINLAWRGS